MSEEKRLITGASDSELRAWDISYLQEVIAYFLITGSVMFQQFHSFVSLINVSTRDTLLLIEFLDLLMFALHVPFQLHRVKCHL